MTRFGRAKPRPTLYQLQSQWDDARARERVAMLRTQIEPHTRADLRWLPLALPIAGLLWTVAYFLLPN